jgi:hypothetical protein
MNRILHDVLFKICFVFIDDIIIFGETEEECIENTQIVIELIFADNLKLGGLKCEYLLTRVDILGHTISDGCLYAKSDKL